MPTDMPDYDVTYRGFEIQVENDFYHIRTGAFTASYGPYLGPVSALKAAMRLIDLLHEHYQYEMS